MPTPTDAAKLPLTVRDVEAAAHRLKGKAVLTPLMESPQLNDRLGGRLLVKAEPLQRTGSFKFRGAYNRISLIPEEVRGRGVIAFSSGNHAQGVAAAARAFGIKATIIMPTDAPAIKVRNTRAWGAEVVLYDRWTESREAIGQKLSDETGATLVRPYDDPGVMAGQGTIGLEIAAQAEALGVMVDTCVVCCGGGGLVAGTALALLSLSPTTKVLSAEPEGFDDTARSLAAGTRVANEPGRQSFCDAIVTPTPGELTFEVNRRLLAGGVAVSDREVAQAMRTAFEELKLVVEPGGAVALAAALAGKVPVQGRTVVVVCSGGNVDADVFAKALADAA
ncbi:MAG TPA: threonine/serine dehydratase [Azospirillaceae bacterium]|nr:threonine/serine dehydratase [Azospirillaceae bacterium]